MPYKCISIDEAKILIDKGDVALADVRDPGAFTEANIANSVNVLEGNIEAFISQTEKDKPLVVYCYHGNTSKGAADYFASKGYTEVYSVDEGFEAWRLKY